MFRRRRLRLSRPRRDRELGAISLNRIPCSRLAVSRRSGRCHPHGDTRRGGQALPWLHALAPEIELISRVTINKISYATQRQKTMAAATPATPSFV